MEISITGKQIDIGNSLRSYVEEHLESAVVRYFETPLKASVIFSKEGNLIKADISVHAVSDIVVHGEAENADPYAAFDSAAGHISKQLRRYKKRFSDYKSKAKAKAEMANYVVFEPEADNDEEALPQDEAAPVIVAEMQADLPSCTVSGAVMRMDLAGVPALMFRNAAHGGLNMVYRRADGNIGWVDPQSS